jgi:GNAT superfamily N-acetyltransferase
MTRYTAIGSEEVLRDGERVQVYPLGAGDRALVAEVFTGMGPESRRRRFMAVKPRLTEAELRYLSNVDHVSHDAIVALDESGRAIGIARYADDSERPGSAEIAVEVIDAYHGRGIGSMLVSRIVERARANGYTRLTATMLWDNSSARAVFKELGFSARGSAGYLELVRDLTPPSRTSAPRRVRGDGTGSRALRAASERPGRPSSRSTPSRRRGSSPRSPAPARTPAGG